jgi:uncharacterized protein YkwD
MRRFIEWLKRLFGIGTKPLPPVTPVPPVTPPTPPTPIDSIEQIKQKLLQFHNQNRAAKNLPPLKRIAELDRSAQLHNDYMARNGRLTHDEPGRSLGQRVKEQGYNWNYVGENIAMGQRTPEEVMESWMNSSGHKANILNPNFNDIGFGVSQANNTWWWTVNFGRKQAAL